MRKLAITTAAALGALAAVCAWGEVGSVISSFPWPGARNVYRGADYAYSVASPNTLRAYTVNGSLVNSVNLAGLTDAGDADHSVLGGGYLAVLDGANMLRDYVVSTGSLARSVAVPDKIGYGYIPGGAYMYVAAGAYVHRYTTAGSLVSSFRILGPYIGGIAATRTFEGRSGEYVVVAVWAYDSDVGMVYTATGSTVATFSIPGTTHGCVCGPGYPASFGTTFWCNSDVGGRRAYQLDLGNGTAVAPVSLGRIRALFR
ncbi:MAG TPA: hypothetical protein VMX79_10215 [bacterium]|nr:hypothetical protein [bacterium]